jgi:hypothetical protein
VSDLARGYLNGADRRQVYLVTATGWDSHGAHGTRRQAVRADCRRDAMDLVTGDLARLGWTVATIPAVDPLPFDLAADPDPDQVLAALGRRLSWEGIPLP